MSISSNRKGGLNQTLRKFCQEQRIVYYNDNEEIEKTEPSIIESSDDITSVLSTANLRVHPVKLTSYARLNLIIRLQRWRQTHNAHTLELLGLYLNREPLQLFYISEKPDMGNVMDYINQNPSCNRVSMLQDIVEGLDHLHRKTLVHGAIRGDNVFVREDGSCCIGELSLAERPDSECLRSDKCWLAPELFNIDLMRRSLIDGYRDYSGNYTSATDIFAVGCLAVQMYTGEPPAPQRFPHNVKSYRDMWELDRVASTKEAECIPASIWPLIATMLSYSPRERSKLSQYLEALKKPNPGKAMRLLANVPPLFAKNQARRIIRAGV